MTQPILNKRDTRIDVFRALALLTIFINHVPGTIFEYLTHKNLGFSDSAEAFVLISGVAVGLAYGAKFSGENRLFIALKLWRRSLTLYSTHILMTIISLTIFLAAAIIFHYPEFLRFNNIPTILKDPANGLLGVVTLGHQLGYNNILPLYMVLMLAAPLMLYLANKNMQFLLFVSGALYLFAGFYGIAPHNFPSSGVWFLNPLSWQLLFVIGVAATMHIKRGGQLPSHPLLLLSAVVYLVLSLICVRFGLWSSCPNFGLPNNLIGFNKTFLSLPRLLHILALTYLIVMIPQIHRLAKVAPSNALAILGKHSLPIFVAGTLFAMLAQVLKRINTGGLFYDSLLIATGIVLQFALAYYLEWHKVASKQVAAGTKKVAVENTTFYPDQQNANVNAKASAR